MSLKRGNYMKRRNEDTQKIPIIHPEEYGKYDEYYEKNTNLHHNQNDNNRKQHKRNKTKITKVLISVILIITLIFVSSAAGLYVFFSRTNYQPQSNNTDINFRNLSDRVYNILLIGTDMADNGSSRSDSMILLSINKNKKQINMISFLRDLWVDIPKNDSGRLNSAFAIDGAGLVIETIEYNFDIQIDNYVLVDFEMFKQLIDELGGIEVEITEKEAKFINKTTKAKVKKGINTLNGYEALVYCRIRKLDSDFMRTFRQRKVLNAILEAIKNQSIFNTVSAGYSILPLITTDISPSKMIIKAISTSQAINFEINQQRIPAEDTYSNETIRSQDVLVADIDQNKQILQDIIYN